MGYELQKGIALLGCARTGMFCGFSCQSQRRYLHGCCTEQRYTGRLARPPSASLSAELGTGSHWMADVHVGIGALLWLVSCPNGWRVSTQDNSHMKWSWGPDDWNVFFLLAFPADQRILLHPTYMLFLPFKQWKNCSTLTFMRVFCFSSSGDILWSSTVGFCSSPFREKQCSLNDFSLFLKRSSYDRRFLKMLVCKWHCCSLVERKKKKKMKVEPWPLKAQFWKEKFQIK